MRKLISLALAAALLLIPTVAIGQDEPVAEEAGQVDVPADMSLVRVVRLLGRYVAAATTDLIEEDDAMPSIHERRDHAPIEI